MIFLFCIVFPLGVFSSEIGAAFGDAAVSQVLRHAATKVLQSPRTVEVLLKTSTNPTLGSLANVDLLSLVQYKNLSLHFHPNSLLFVIDNLALSSHANVSHLLWPLGMGDQLVDMNLKLARAELSVDVLESSLFLRDCALSEANLVASVPDHWMADKGASLLASLLNPVLDHTICHGLRHYVAKVQHSKTLRFPLYDVLPDKARNYLSASNTTFFYRLKSIEATENQLIVLAQLEWQEFVDSPEVSILNANDDNNTLLNVQLQGDDRVTIWLEDQFINDLLSQVEWDFEWMNEQIPVSSSVIPPDSREFLSTLCTECYFQVNVAARGQPTVQATNDSLVLEKRDRVHLQVVNPNRNMTSVFVSFVLTIQAEIRPQFDDGTLRTLVQLLDTNITMEAGAFPKTWGLFMQDLMKGMIMDMLWPELKNGIEEVSYGKGLRIPRACGLDPNKIKIDIGEGNFALSTRLILPRFDPDKCIKDLKASLPSTSKLFGKQKT